MARRFFERGPPCGPRPPSRRPLRWRAGVGHRDAGGPGSHRARLGRPGPFVEKLGRKSLRRLRGVASGPGYRRVVGTSLPTLSTALTCSRSSPEGSFTASVALLRGSSGGGSRNGSRRRRRRPSKRSRRSPGGSSPTSRAPWLVIGTVSGWASPSRSTAGSPCCGSSLAATGTRTTASSGSLPALRPSGSPRTQAVP